MNARLYFGYWIHVLVFNYTLQEVFFTAETLICHSRKSQGETNIVYDAFSVPVRPESTNVPIMFNV